MILPLNQPCDLSADATTLAHFYAVIDAVPDALAGQHPIRRWEYAMALRAIQEWQDVTGQAYLDHVANAHTPNAQPAVGSLHPLQICDVGGAGSNFWQLLRGLTTEPIILIDPAAVVPPSPNSDHGFFPCTVEAYAAANGHEQFDVVTCISVIEHVKDLSPFFRACRMLLKPGGLLFLTTDYWDVEGEDTAHFHWMRERIYNADTIRRLGVRLRELGFKTFGSSAWSPYPGPQCYDYSMCSLALTRKAIP